MGESSRYDGHAAGALRALLDVPAVELRETVGSALDVAHELGAAGAPAGTLVVADEQTAGRGRGGRAWASAPGAGIWLALLERPRDAGAVELLSLRLGLRAAPVLDRYAGERVLLKWPNDLYVGRGKLAGILVETRWREDRVDWVAIGVGVNVRPPSGYVGAGSLRPGTDRVAVLAGLVPALRAAAAARGKLTPAELDAFASRDLARGRACREPAAGVVQGVDADGAIVVMTAAGRRAIRTGSLVLEGGA